MVRGRRGPKHGTDAPGSSGARSSEGKTGSGDEASRSVLFRSLNMFFMLIISLASLSCVATLSARPFPGLREFFEARPTTEQLNVRALTGLVTTSSAAGSCIRSVGEDIIKMQRFML
ncbi:hypothetical protein PM082_014590 [Marasmius tenuissimus]|nr:hypothetical protein PM082_014590 [Marasmius tenuissimus]